MNYQVATHIAAGVILLIWYIREKIKAYSMKALYIKIAVSVCFIATAMAGTAKGGQSSLLYGVLITAGLVFGLMGDIVLDLKYIDREREDLHTKSGFVLFGIGHVIFMVAMYSRFGQFITPSLLFVAAALIIGFAGGFTAAKSGKLVGNDFGSYFGIVAGYCITLASTFAMAAVYAVVYAKAPAFASPSRALNILTVGFILFMISDAILSCTYFGKDHHKPADIILNYLFYYGAQFLIALSVSYA